MTLYRGKSQFSLYPGTLYYGKCYQFQDQFVIDETFSLIALKKNDFYQNEIAINCIVSRNKRHVEHAFRLQ